MRAVEGSPGCRPGCQRARAAPEAEVAGAIVGEWFGDTVGLGVMLLQALYFEQITRVWVLIIACGLLADELVERLVCVQ